MQDIIVKNIFISKDKEQIKKEINKKIQKILQKAG